MKVNLDLAGTNSDNDIVDELKSNVGSDAFDLTHDRFFGTVALLRIWTGAGETGTQLILDTDYTMQGLDSDLTAEAIVQVWSQVKIENVTYQTGNLYFNYHAAADEVDAEDFDIDISSPVGSIVMYGASSAPTGWINCDGASLLRAGTYAALFAVIGTTYGSADGTHFNVPDFRGIFPRGSGTNGTLLDANGSSFVGILGTYQNDKTQGHKHNNGAATGGADMGTGSGSQRVPTTTPIDDGVNGTPRTGTETNPANLGVNFIIKI